MTYRKTSEISPNLTDPDPGWAYLQGMQDVRGWRMKGGCLSKDVIQGHNNGSFHIKNYLKLPNQLMFCFVQIFFGKIHF